MGALGRRGTGKHKSKTSIRQNGQAGLGFRCMYDRSITENTCMDAQT